MTEVVSVRFNQHGKIYFFAPEGNDIKTGDTVIVETAKGLDIGFCAVGNHFVEDDAIVPPLRPVVRTATAEDLKVAEDNKIKEKEAFEICRKKIIEHSLDMKLVDVECSFEGNKILFFFTSDGRVDFRELVKDLASVFRTRIELRQIGVRDETKLLGGLGICGRPYCCSQFLSDFEPVSTKMAKTQSMSLNPTKISGSCGRLMCCLRYEQAAYEDLVKTIPKMGAFVQTTEGYGNVIQTNILRQKVKVRLDGEGEPELKTFAAEQVASVPGGRPKPGEAMPEVLHYVAPEVSDEQEDDPWKAPTLFADWGEAKPEPQADKPKAENAPKRNEGRRRPNNRPRPQQEQKAGNNAGGQKNNRPGDKQQAVPGKKQAPPHQQRPKQQPRPQKQAGANSPKPQNSKTEGAKPGEKSANSAHRRHYSAGPKNRGNGPSGNQGGAQK